MHHQTVMLHCPCQLTRFGLEQLIGSGRGAAARLRIIDSPPNGVFPDYYPVSALDTLILVPCWNMERTLTLLNSLSRLYPVTLKVVLITDREIPAWICHYLRQQMNLLGAWDLRLPLAQLQR